MFKLTVAQMTSWDVEEAAHREYGVASRRPEGFHTCSFMTHLSSGTSIYGGF